MALYRLINHVICLVYCREVLAVKERMKSKLYGCNAIQRVTPLFALIQGAKISTDTCTISLGLSIDDYLSPQVGCVHDFMNNVSTLCRRMMLRCF